MSEPQNNQVDDLVTQAVVATRQLPIPDGPSPASVSNTLMALHAAANRPKLTLLQRIDHMPWKSKAAALLGIAASALVVYAVLSATSSSSIALAQVIDKIAAAKLLVFDITAQSIADKKLTVTGHVTFGESGKMRADIKDPRGSVVSFVTDGSAGNSMVLLPGAKMAIMDALKINNPKFFEMAPLERIRLLLQQCKLSLGKKEIDGIETEGFEGDKSGAKVRLWVNVKTLDPVRMDINNLLLPPPCGPGNIVMTNFKLDEKPDPSLFNVQPPEGFTVIKSPIPIELGNKPTADVATILRIYAKRNDGRFPDRLVDLAKVFYKDLETETSKDGGKLTADSTELTMVQGALTGLEQYFAVHKEGADYEYFPGGKLGEKERLVLWYKDDKSGEYTAVYGDLRVEKIDKEKLPPPPENDGKQ